MQNDNKLREKKCEEEEELWVRCVLPSEQSQSEKKNDVIKIQTMRRGQNSNSEAIELCFQKLYRGGIRGRRPTRHGRVMNLTLCEAHICSGTMATVIKLQMWDSECCHSNSISVTSYLEETQ